MFCKNCGYRTDDNDSFCTNCGFAIEDKKNLKVSNKLGKKNSFWLFFVVIFFLLIFNFISNNNSDKIYSTLEENISNNCEKYTSYIQYDNSNESWKSTVDIGNCDGEFVKHSFSLKKGDEPSYMEKYNYRKSTYKINFDERINELFDQILYYDAGDLYSTKVILYGYSVKDIDNYREQLEKMNEYLKENSSNVPSVEICFTSENNFLNNDYYKAFMVYDMPWIRSRYKSNIKNIDKITITECTPLIYISGNATLSSGEPFLDFDYAKENPITLRD